MYNPHQKSNHDAKGCAVGKVNQGGYLNLSLKRVIIIKKIKLLMLIYHLISLTI